MNKLSENNPFILPQGQEQGHFGQSTIIDQLTTISVYQEKMPIWSLQARSRHTFNGDISKFYTDHLKHIIVYNEKKEDYYLTGIKNLIKKNNFLQLSLTTSDDSESEADFEKEISDHPHKYIIDIKPLDNERDLNIISEIVKKIGVEFTIDDVSELFSVDNDCILKIANNIEK
ncbi:MAG: hypothetical protein SGJ10_04155 [Bacteroidota bacterium]|nr:hypothetical protein [Bacteroidota bacterium]